MPSRSAITNAKRLMSLVVLLLGAALVVRTTLEAGSLTISTGTFAGGAFMLYGAVRLYYSRGAS